MILRKTDATFTIGIHLFYDKSNLTYITVNRLLSRVVIILSTYECIIQRKKSVVIIIRNLYYVCNRFWSLNQTTYYTFITFFFTALLYIYIFVQYIYLYSPIQEVCSRVACNSAFSFSRWGMRVAEYAIVKPTAMWKDAAMMQAAICENCYENCYA